MKNIWHRLEAAYVVLFSPHYHIVCGNKELNKIEMFEMGEGVNALSFLPPVENV